MTNETKHTPTPWFSKNYGYEKNSVFDENGTEIAFVHYSFNAAHIVKCVNMHDELVEALRPFATEVLDNYDDDSYPDVCTPQAKAYRYAISVLKKAGAL